MNNIIYVGLGGATGAILRYLLSLVTVKCDFPLMTFLTNIIGAFAIGLIVGMAASNQNFPPKLLVFLKTGVCGGFTTFSTFSLEAWTLLEAKNYLAGGSYIVLSLVICIAGVAAGIFVGHKVVLQSVG